MRYARVGKYRRKIRLRTIRVINNWVSLFMGTDRMRNDDVTDVPTGVIYEARTVS
jgi:hypothetical protein